MAFLSTTTDQDDLLKAIKSNTGEIKNVVRELKRMNNKENEESKVE